MHMDTHIHKNDPASILPNYEDMFSGNKTEDNTIYKFAYPSSYYPILNLGYPIYDNMGNKLDPGHYEVALSFDKKYLLLIQSKRLVAKIPVISHDFDKYQYDVHYARYEKLKSQLEKYQVKTIDGLSITREHHKGTLASCTTYLCLCKSYKELFRKLTPRF